MVVKLVALFMADIHLAAALRISATILQRPDHLAEILLTTMAAVLVLQLVHGACLQPLHLIIATLGNKVLVVPPAGVHGAIRTIPVHALIGAILTQTQTPGIIQTPEAHGVTPHLVIHRLVEPAAAVDSQVLVGSVVAVATAVVVETQDNDLIRSSFYSIQLLM